MENIDLKQSINRMEQEIVTLKNDKIRQLENYAHEAKKFQESSASYRQLLDQCQNMDMRMRELTEENRKLKNQGFDLQGRLQKALQSEIDR